LGRNDKLKLIKEELRRLRFPCLVRLEGEIQKRIRQMGPGPQIQMTVVPGLEGGALTVQLRATSHEELQRLLAVLGQLSGRTEMKEIFDLLAGREQGAELSA
jgi:Tfp pilus assembly protein PilN